MTTKQQQRINSIQSIEQTNMFTYYEARQFTEKIVAICDGILLRAGPYHKEGLYQTLLIHELAKLGIPTTRERVFNMVFKDSEGKDVFVGDNQSLRTDIELPTLKGILELKSSGNSTKDENIWQLRNYLEQRDDMTWGIVINFISKFGTRTSPKVQCDLVFPVNKEIFDREVAAARIREEQGISPVITSINTSCCGPEHNEGMIRGVHMTRIWTETMCSEDYPSQDSIVFDYDNAIHYNDVPYPGNGDGKFQTTIVESSAIKIDTEVTKAAISTEVKAEIKTLKKKRKKKKKDEKKMEWGKFLEEVDDCSHVTHAITQASYKLVHGTRETYGINGKRLKVAIEKSDSMPTIRRVNPKNWPESDITLFNTCLEIIKSHNLYYAFETVSDASSDSGSEVITTVTGN